MEEQNREIDKKIKELEDNLDEIFRSWNFSVNLRVMVYVLCLCLLLIIFLCG